MDRSISALVLPHDFADFAELERVSFGEDMNLDEPMHQWLFEANPDNPVPGTMMYVMREGERMIAADGLIPQRLQIGAKTYLAAHSVKSMTHPDFKRQGIFTTMTNYSIEQARQSGVDIIIGLANANSYPAYVKFNYLTIFERTFMVKPLRLTSFLAQRLPSPVTSLATIGNAVFRAVTPLSRKPRLPKGMTVELAASVPAEVDSLWESVRSSFDCLLVRDYRYLNHRYNERPDAHYETILLRDSGRLIGLAVVRFADAASRKVASVVEFLCDPTSAKIIDVLARVVSWQADLHGCDYLVLGVGGHGKTERRLKRLGFVSRSNSRNNMMIALILNDEIQPDQINGFERWHITQGDGEIELDL
ncbi:MAG: GNAT family N-acetyltransferase [Propionibacteriaceae bacterium]